VTSMVRPGLVSVIVASYNHAEYLERRMDSLIRQTYQTIEILVIDDCSSDNSVEVLRKYEYHPKVRLIIRENNGGWVAVSNQGIEMTVGEFVIFANCDDSCDPLMIERLVTALTLNTTSGIAFCRSLMVNEKDQVLGDDFQNRETAFRHLCARDTLIGRDEMYRFLLHSCVIPNLSAALIRRSCFDSIGVLSPDYRACSDWDLFFRITNHFDFYYVTEPLNRFRQHSTTIRSATKGRITYDEFFKLLLGEIRRKNLSSIERFYFRLHVMYLWAVELIRPSISGWRNFYHHTRIIWKIDPLSIFLLLPAMLRRILELPWKAACRMIKQVQKPTLHTDIS
jgi:glycosyltransferase involved in cell wall biosynthesis